MHEIETLEGILIKVGKDILTVADAKTYPDPKGIFRYSYRSLAFDASCSGKIHLFQTKSTPLGLCEVVSYRCSHE